MGSPHESQPDAATPHAPMDFTSPNAPVVAQLATVPVRPLGITIISVLGILAGLAGLLSGLMGVANLFLGEMLTNAFAPAAGTAASTQLEMQQALQAVTRAFFIPSLLVLLVQLGVSAGLLVGGIGLLRDRRWARDLITKTLVVAIGWEVVRGILYGVIQWKTYPIISSFMSKMAGEEQAGSAIVAQLASIGVIVGAVFWLIWSLAKIGMMAWARLYLQGPTVEAYLATSDPVSNRSAEVSQ